MAATEEKQQSDCYASGTELCLESLSLAGSEQFETIRHSIVCPPHSDRTPGTALPRRIAALYNTLNGSARKSTNSLGESELRPEANPDRLLQEMMLSHLIRPTFNVTRETQRFLQLSDLLKEGRVAGPWEEFDATRYLPISPEVLASLQMRLEDPQQTPYSDNPFSATSDPVVPRTITLVDLAIANLKDSDESFTTFYRLKLIVAISRNPASIRRLNKLRPSKNSVGLSAVWEKRTFRFREFLDEVEKELNRRDGTGPWQRGSQDRDE